MRWIKKHLLQLLIPVLMALMVLPANAVQPDEVLSDPALEARARALSVNLRCLVCQNQSIDGSNAELAKDLRVLVRARLTAGDTDKEVMDYIVSRYGDFVLLKPSFSAKNLFLWLTPILVLLLGGIFAFRKMNMKPQESASMDLSIDEKNKLKQILDE
ncbi:cytochrome c-type biogenesis protein [Lentilitoribacter sp. Alg239-R112]|jgi:cytochrome c-type biogenesis protein CcmH|uniref:cytochrome c-type biogenesis protein n=1 Tax=Lentilitoribacter sp. Alg239-R112 TaxID=2305987 RepID=UPI0013A6F84E|nr:cytochrome c-type biogenesis protein [Lentilitoribacter sp. Alg239-R112]